MLQGHAAATCIWRGRLIRRVSYAHHHGHQPAAIGSGHPFIGSGALRGEAAAWGGMQHCVELTGHGIHMAGQGGSCPDGGKPAAPAGGNCGIAAASPSRGRRIRCTWGWWGRTCNVEQSNGGTYLMPATIEPPRPLRPAPCRQVQQCGEAGEAASASRIIQKTAALTHQSTCGRGHRPGRTACLQRPGAAQVGGCACVVPQCWRTAWRGVGKAGCWHGCVPLCSRAC